MARRLIQQYLQSASGENSEEVDWKTWIMKETIRRTVFLVNIINTLSCRIQKQDPYFFEPLDDNLVRNMALPAPESVWKASSAENWMAAKAQLGLDDIARSRLTLQQAMDRFGADGDRGDNQSTARPQQIGGTYRQQFDQLDEFTRLVVATADHR